MFKNLIVIIKLNMLNLNKSTTDNIVKDCLNLYRDLPKSGKPSDNEWSVLSCIIQYNMKFNNYKVVSLGTGTKCIGASKMSRGGDVLNDSHAEIIARRGFLLYLYDNILRSLRNKESIFFYKDERFELKEEIKFIFYSSQLPCGDACIIPKTDEECFGDVLINKKHKAETEIDYIQYKKPKLEVTNDIHRTGAKCLPHIEQDPKEAGMNYHLLGKVRTKPGRGERTLSVSCSDKIARWIHIGIQGSLLNLLLSEPIHISSYIFGAGVPYCEKILNRALLNRETVKPFYTIIPTFCQSSIKFDSIKNEERSKPAPASIMWVNTSDRLIEVSVQGKKLGVTKKKSNSISSYLSICKYNLFKKFLEVLKLEDGMRLNICNEMTLTGVKYNEIKRKSKTYNDNWRHIKEMFFKTWTVKPDMWNFIVSDV